MVYEDNKTVEQCEVCENYIEDYYGYEICECGTNCCDECSEPNPNDDEDGERYCILCVPRSKVVCDDEVEVHIDSKLKPV